MLYDCPTDLYNKLTSITGYVICPSEIEGYGHYINEARYKGSYIITVDRAPMKNFAIGPSQLISVKALIPFHKRIHRPYLIQDKRILCAEIDIKHLSHKLSSLDEITSEQYNFVIQKQFELFIQDSKFFEQSLINLLYKHPLIRKNNIIDIIDRRMLLNAIAFPSHH
jgi:hypothetical protein